MILDSRKMSVTMYVFNNSFRYNNSFSKPKFSENKFKIFLSTINGMIQMDKAPL